MMIKLSGVGLACTFVVFGAMGSGCSGADPLTPTAFCAQKATKECDGVALRCATTAEACHADRVAACSEFVSNQTPVATRPFRPDRAGACLDATAATYLKATITPDDRLAMKEACERVFAGSKKKGATCGSSLECDGDLICDTSSQVCAAKRVVAEGDFCNNPGDVCSAGQFCVGVPGTRQCKTPTLQAGQVCDDILNPCAPELRCVSGSCIAKLGANAVCAVDSDCAMTVPYCDPFFGNTCDVGFTPSRGAPECQDFGSTM